MSVSKALADALARIPARKVAVDADDDILRDEIRHVEDALNRMQPGFICQVETSEGFLSFEPGTKRWLLYLNHKPLLGALRDPRAAVFQPGESGLSPIERLVIAVANRLETAATSRSPMLEVARRLAAALTKAGYPPPT